MSGHGETIRNHITSVIHFTGETGWEHEPPSDQDALAALDALLAENQRLRDALEEIAHDPDSLLLRAKQIAREALRSEQ